MAFQTYPGLPSLPCRTCSRPLLMLIDQENDVPSLLLCAPCLKVWAIESPPDDDEEEN